MYRLEASTIRLQSRTGSQSNRQIHIGFERDVISSFAQWRFNPEFTRLSIDWHVHEAIECNGNLVGRDAVRFQRSRQVTKAALVRILVAVDDAKGVFAARREKKVMSAHGVFNDTEHDIAPIGV